MKIQSRLPADNYAQVHRYRCSKHAQVIRAFQMSRHIPYRMQGFVSTVKPH